MDRSVKDKNVLNSFVSDFVAVLDAQKIRYIIVSGFVAIAHGRRRGTEDIDLIAERIPAEKFILLHAALLRAGFECVQESNPQKLYSDYLADNLSLRYVRKGTFVPEMEFKLAKDELDEMQLHERVKLPLTGLPFWFSSIETNIAFKEELLKSEKDMEDSKHLRIIYSEKIDEGKIRKYKNLIRRLRLGGA